MVTDNEITFKNIDYNNKTVSKPAPDKMPSIDTDELLFDNIIAASDENKLDMNSLNSFTNISRARDTVYDLIDEMAQDSTISAILDIYAADATETNDQGQVVWVSAEDKNVAGMVEHLLDSMNINKNAFGWVYSLIKYGDLYLRLYRESEYNDPIFNTKDIGAKEQLNENVIVKAYSKNDRYAEYMEMNKNPAEVFELTRFGKTIGYIKTHIPKVDNLATAGGINGFYQNYNYNYNFDISDVDVFAATEFVHACLEDNSNRTTEEVTISTDAETQVTYSVRRGQSLLYDSFKVWRELALLENSVLLNRLTRSAIVRIISVEVGDMEKADVRTLLTKIKQMIEQKSAINVNRSLTDYTNPGPIENTIYVPTHDGKGAVSPQSVGGDVNVGDLVDLDYWKNKLTGSLSIPKQYLGDTDDSTGFNGGTSLSLISSRYAKTVKRIQNTFIQAITDAINLMLFDRGLTSYINKFTIKMQAPTTQEEKDRKENLANTINTIQSIMGLLDLIEDNTIKLIILKSLLSEAISDTTVIQSIQDEIDRLEAEQEGEAEGETEEEGGSDEFDFGGGDFDFGGEEGGGELPTPEETGSTEFEAPEEPAEGFETNKGGAEILNEENDLPSFEELGINYTDIH